MRRLATLCASVAFFALPAVAAAHPLGNFTINHSSSVVVSGDRVYVHYVLDMAEIPTLQGRQAGRINATALHREVVPDIELLVDGRRVQLKPKRQRLQLPPGAGGLPTARYELVLAGPRFEESASLTLRDETYAGRIGWKEVVVSALGGARISSSSAPAVSPSRQLRAYPADGLSSPLTVTQARAKVDPGDGQGTPPQLTSPMTEEHGSGFESLVTRDLGATGILLALALALFWGAAHALGPGHGKSIVAAYLIGQRGTVRHAAYLGGIVTVTHTAGVFALGAITLLLSEFIVPEDLYPWLNLLAGLMVVAIGVTVLRVRLSHRRAHKHGHHHHITTTTTTTTITTSRRARCSRWESRAACCRARPRSSCCWRRSLCTAPPSASRSCSRSASVSRSRSRPSASWPSWPEASSAARASTVGSCVHCQR